jgi:glycosyltransferase involved in cell wall biosynthesis
MRPTSARRLLFISQVYVPDPASVGQHMADAAEAMAARGSHVVVLTSARGYEDPGIKYPRHECLAGVDVVRLPLASFGKRTLAHRVLGQGLFLLQVIVRGLFVRRLTGLVVSTSPPMASFAAVVIGFIRRVPITYWLADLNPDQLIVLGKASPRSPLVLAMKWLNRRILSRAADVVVNDRFMAERIEKQYHVNGRVEILPPWPHHEALNETSPADNPFRLKHNPSERFVVMYSGNHSPASPVTTLLQAALRMRDDPRFLFMFIGGGLGKHEVDAAIAADRLTNVTSLPYQPLDQIKFSLSAADLHVVTLGEHMPGIVHPCKIYGAMAVGRPILLIGPRPSHAADLIDRYQIGWQVDQGDISGTITAIRHASSLPSAARAEVGERARAAVRDRYSKARLRDAFCDVIERHAAPKARRGSGSRFAVGNCSESTARDSSVDSTADSRPGGFDRREPSRPEQRELQPLSQ